MKSLPRWVEQMDDGNLATVELYHGAVDVLDEDLGVDRKDEHWAALSEQDLALVWVRCVSRVVHCNPVESLEVVDANNK